MVREQTNLWSHRKPCRHGCRRTACSLSAGASCGSPKSSLASSKCVLKNRVTGFWQKIMDAAEATNGGVAPSAEPQTTSQPVSIAKDIVISVCVCWGAAKRFTGQCVWVSGDVLALASHKLHTSFAQQNEYKNRPQPIPTHPNYPPNTC